MKIVDRLRHSLRTVSAGPNWYGPNLANTLAKVDADQACLRIGSSHNIAELVRHMMAWREYVTTMLVERRALDISDDQNFPRVNSLTPSAWQALKDAFADSGERLAKAINSAPMDLSVESPKNKYSWIDVLEGVIHHDIYHCGQLNFLIKHV